MKYKIEQYERCETTSSGSIEDHLIGITKPSIDRMLKMENAGDCIALYTFYCYTRKWQKNSIPKATSEYAMDGLKWGRERFSKAKANLLELGLIEDVQRIGENGRVLGWYIGVKFAQNATKGEFQIAELQENHPTGFPQGGETRVRENRIQIPVTGNKIPNTSKQIQLNGRENSAMASSSTSDELPLSDDNQGATAQVGKANALFSIPPQTMKTDTLRGQRKSPPKPRQPKLVDDSFIAELKKLNPTKDVDAEVIAAKNWLLAHPPRQFTKPFFSSWINRTKATIDPEGSWKPTTI
jgi:hypothetical protein